MSRLVIVAGLVIALAPLVQTRAEPAAPPEHWMVTLRIEGIHSEEDAKRVLEALKKVPNIKVATRPTLKQPETLVGQLRGATWELGDLARAVAQTKTPNRAQGAPSATLVLTYKPSRRELETEAAFKMTLETRAENLKGIDVTKCRLDAEKHELHIKLDDKGGAKLADVKAALAGWVFEE